VYWSLFEGEVIRMEMFCRTDVELSRVQSIVNL
jgi:hypothetical protein